VAWLAFTHFKGCFVRPRPATFFWFVGVVSILLGPAYGLRRRPLRLLLGAAAGLGLLGTVLAGRDDWQSPVTGLRLALRSLNLLVGPAETYASLGKTRQEVMAAHRLPRIAAALGDGRVDLLTLRERALLLNGFRWQPRPVFQGYCTYTPRLARLNADFCRSAAAPENVILDGEAIDGRLPTLDDGPALLEVLHAYRPVFHEHHYLLLRRRPGPAPEILGDVLLERDLRFGDAVDLAT